MKRLALSVAALAAVATLSACSSDEETPAPAPTPSTSTTPTDEPSVEPTEELAADRFTSTLTEMKAVSATMGEQADVAPTSTEEANAAAGLDETTPLVFADYTVDPADSETGAFCLEALNGTYFTLAYGGEAGEVTFGDGECSYSADDAAVVGDPAADTWSKGAELMGEFVPSDIFN